MVEIIDRASDIKMPFTDVILDFISTKKYRNAVEKLEGYGKEYNYKYILSVFKKELPKY